MAKTNYSFAKHQREVAKKQKKEEKRQRKAGVLSKTESVDSSKPDTALTSKTP